MPCNHDGDRRTSANKHKIKGNAIVPENQKYEENVSAATPSTQFQYLILQVQSTEKALL